MLARRGIIESAPVVALWYSSQSSWCNTVATIMRLCFMAFGQFPHQVQCNYNVKWNLQRYYKGVTYFLQNENTDLGSHVYLVDSRLSKEVISRNHFRREECKWAQMKISRQRLCSWGVWRTKGNGKTPEGKHHQRIWQLQLQRLLTFRWQGATVWKISVSMCIVYFCGGKQWGWSVLMSERIKSLWNSTVFFYSLLLAAQRRLF